MKTSVYPTSLPTGLVCLFLLLMLTACDSREGNSNTNAPTSSPTGTPSPTNTSSPTSTPSLTGTYPPTNTPYPEPLHPCGPSELYYAGRLQEHFLHWTHDGSRLVFDVDDTIWVMDLQQVTKWQVADVDVNYDRVSDEGSMLRLEYGFHADLSPDDSSIVYSTCEYWDGRQVDTWEGAWRTGQPKVALEAYEIAMVDIDGRERKRLTEAEGFVNYPSWSPDGEYIAVVAYTPGGDSQPSIGHYHYSEYGHQYQMSVDVALIAANGTSPQEETLARIQSPGSGRVALYAPVWSPSGRQLAYLVYEGEEYLFTTAVFVADIDGSDLARIGHAESPPTWSPDGEELAFVSVEEEEVVVYASSPDGAVQREVWRGTGGYGQAYWSPDGTEILVITDQAYLVSADGGEQRALVPDRRVSHAAWSPDGSMIALRDEFSISMVSRDGAYLHVLVEIDRDGRLQLAQSTQPEAATDPATSSPGAGPTEPTATAPGQE